ncbi:hypothetical protein JTE90_014327, partial [Oedothorax gibbosus]
TDVRHISGIENTVANAFSRVHIDSVTNADFIDFKAFAAAQQTDDELTKIINSEETSLKLRKQACPFVPVNVCDVYRIDKTICSSTTQESYF